MASRIGSWVPHVCALAASATLALAATPALAQDQAEQIQAHELYEEGDFRIHYTAPWSDFLQKYILFSGVNQGHPGNTVNWYYNDTNRPAAFASADAARQAIQNGMDAWEAVCGVQFVYQGTTTNTPGLALGTGLDGQNVIGWNVATPGHAGSGGIASSGGQVIEGDVWYNSGYAPSPATVVHELGHMLGISHSDVNGVVMSGPPDSTYTGNPNLPLQPDDIAACVHLYGPPSSGTAAAAVSPSSLNFGYVVVGNPSTTQTVTLTNSGTAALTLSAAPAVSGPFTRQGGTCANGTSLAPSASCTVTVTFNPTAIGSASGSLSFSHNATPATSVVALNGNGVAAPVPVAQLSPNPVTFANTNVGAQSATVTATLSNTGAAPLTLSAAPTVTGPFTLVSTTCSTATPVAAGASCQAVLRFAPTAAGLATGTLRIAHNATPNISEIDLRGTGVGTTTAPAVQVSPASLSYSNVTAGAVSGASAITVSNTGTAPLNFSVAPAVTGPFAIAGGSCAVGTPVAAGSSCTVLVTFNPATVGTFPGSLVLRHNATPNTTTVGLTGTSVAAPAPGAQINPSVVNFGSITVGTVSAASTVTLTNNGTAALNLSAAPSVTGPFAVVAGGTCAVGTPVSAGGSCTVNVTFNPTVVGAATGMLTLSHNAGTSTAQLNGTATAAPAPVARVSASQLTFGVVDPGNTSAPQTLTLTNSGTAPMSLTAAPVVSGPFTITGGTCAAGTTLAPGASCTVDVAFSPTATGLQTGTLTFAHSAAGSPLVVSLHGGVPASATPVPATAPWTLALLFAGLAGLAMRRRKA